MTLRYAGLVSRAVSRVLDAALLAVFVAGSAWIVKQFLGIDPERCPEVREWWNVRARLCGLMPYFIPVAGVIVPPVYRTLFYVVSGQTPGMAVMGLRLLRADGRHVRLRQALKRIAVFYVTLGLGSLLIPVSGRRRAFHDIVAGTVVVYDWGTQDREVRQVIERMGSADA